MKKLLLIIIVIIATPFHQKCFSQKMLKKGILVTIPDYKNEEYLNIIFSSKSLIYSYDSQNKMHLDFTLDSIHHVMRFIQYSNGKQNRELTGIYLLEDNYKVEPLRLTRNYEPYEEHDTVLYQYNAVRDGNWEYYKPDGTVDKVEAYSKGNLIRTFQKDSKEKKGEIKKNKE